MIALRLADLAGAGPEDRAATYYLGLMANVDCHADATEQAKWYGDDISFKGDGFELLDMGILVQALTSAAPPNRAPRMADADGTVSDLDKVDTPDFRRAARPREQLE